jgi:hypothetical protein
LPNSYFKGQRLLKAKGGSNDHITHYASNSFVHHVRNAVTTPLHDDDLAKAWLIIDKNDAILDSLLLGINQIELHELADWYSEVENWFNAAHIFHILGMSPYNSRMCSHVP